MDQQWLPIGLMLFLPAFIAVVWFFFDDGSGAEDGYVPDPGWRDRKAQATSYWEMAEYRDAIDEGPRKAGKKRETPFRRFLRWWTSQPSEKGHE